MASNYRLDVTWGTVNRRRANGSSPFGTSFHSNCKEVNNEKVRCNHTQKQNSLMARPLLSLHNLATSAAV